MRFHLAIVGFGCLLSAASCQPNGPPAAVRLAQPAPNEVFKHEPSDFEFPPSVGDFARETLKQYDPAGLDVSMGYNLGQAAAITVFVYPVHQKPPDNALASHFEAAKREVLNRHKGAAVVAEGAVTAKPGGREQIGQHAIFTYTQVFAQREQAVRSELYIFKHGRWFVKYRVTYPVDEQATVEPAVQAFIEQWSWPKESAK